ncbi:MAG: ATP-NAD kinase family protein [Pseudomonadales bacterium]|jgi:predicted polyphosphate/ATP-dependent NAD kinase|nr:ATP-NAD kinase family protein [Gammaproteobacteria bacterium]MBK6582013.1 ATP-NAD kinase family protein [Gammaproteobacteria bacterium]MBK7170312.1 ATP-NAD kinase family protein [Gammaproteobacteria bacterium]MBK9668359.1 ATP-NAD kinase family protein [Gammaproteobacteria bacterium]MBP6229535.1 ATP-NAD kinase family protein [Pseudomonadales bacterium]
MKPGPGERPFRLGLIVNPLAGIGGAVGLKGSDGAAIVAEARARGAEPRAQARAVRALAMLTGLRSRIELYAAAGVMGMDAAHAAGFEAQVVGPPVSGPTTAQHTQDAARALCAIPVDLLLFAGGDGTARDLCAVVESRLPVLGIPAGVKMHSGVYAVSPEAAGEVVRALIDGALVDIAPGEVRDLDEDAFRGGRVNSRHFGEMRVPAEGRYVQHTKVGGREVEELAIADIAAQIVEEMEPGQLYILGPGTTTFAIKELLGIDGTLLGVDVVRDRECLARDAGEARLLELLREHSGSARIVVTAIGGQGHVFGRGNQQISAAVIRRVGIDNIVIVAAKSKIGALQGRPLLVDTNDPALDQALHRYMQVVTGYRDAILYPLGYDDCATPSD